jgi:hypothetical protein
LAAGSSTVLIATADGTATSTVAVARRIASDATKEFILIHPKSDSSVAATASSGLLPSSSSLSSSLSSSSSSSSLSASIAFSGGGQARSKRRSGRSYSPQHEYAL